MPTIPTPSTGTVISTTNFGIPVANGLNYLDEERFTDWEPALTALIDPIVAMMTSEGTYQIIGEMVDVEGRVDFSGVSDPGTGDYHITLPVTAHVDWVGLAVGAVQYHDDDGTPANRLIVISAGGDDFVMVDADNVHVTDSVPFTAASGDYFKFVLRYRRA